jgi:hypothetical protein
VVKANKIFHNILRPGEAKGMNVIVKKMKRQRSSRPSAFYWLMCRFAACNPALCRKINCFNQRLCQANDVLRKLTGRC